MVLYAYFMPHEIITPRQAAEQSAQNYTTHALAVAAVAHAQAVIDRNVAELNSPETNERHRAIAAWHFEWWSERALPENVKQLKTVNRKAERNHQKNQAAYYQAAVAEALLDGVEISVAAS